MKDVVDVVDDDMDGWPKNLWQNLVLVDGDYLLLQTLRNQFTGGIDGYTLCSLEEWENVSEADWTANVEGNLYKCYRYTGLVLSAEELAKARP